MKQTISLLKELYRYDKTYFYNRLLKVFVNFPIPILYMFYWKNCLLLFSKEVNFSTFLIWSIIILFAQTACSIYNTYFENIFSPCHKNKITYQLKAEIYSNIVNSDFQNYDNEEYMDKYLYSQDKYIEAFYKIDQNIFTTIESILIGSSVFFLVASLDITIILLIVGFVCLNVLFGTKKVKSDFNNSQAQQHNNRIINYIFKVFNTKTYSYEVRIYNYFVLLKNKLLKAYDNNTLLQHKYGKLITIYSIVIDCLSYIFEFILVMVLFIVSLSKNLTVGDFSLIINSSWNLSNRLNTIFRLVPELYSAALTIEEFNRVKSYPSKVENCGNSKIESVNNILFKNVNFRYPFSKDCQLEKINLEIKKGERVAIVGENGSGKSTLVKLLVRLYEPSSGNITINGIELKEITKDFFRLEVGQAMQQNQILPLTIKEYLCGLNMTISDYQIHEALLYSGFGEIMEKKGLNLESLLGTEIDSHGTFLSGGEQQKLFVARAYAQKSNLFIFDEPSSALDPKSEYNLFKKMCDISDDKIIIFISHNMLSTVNADKIVLLNKGQIEEIGTHTQLMEKKGLYYEMFSIQLKRYANDTKDVLQ